MNTATFMGKNFMDNENSIENSTDLTLKKMFDISEKLVSEQEEIMNFSTIQSFIKNYEDLTLKQMFDVTAQLVNDLEEIHGLDKIYWKKSFMETAVIDW